MGSYGRDEHQRELVANMLRWCQTVREVCGTPPAPPKKRPRRPPRRDCREMLRAA